MNPDLTGIPGKVLRTAILLNGTQGVPIIFWRKSHSIFQGRLRYYRDELDSRYVFGADGISLLARFLKIEQTDNWKRADRSQTLPGLIRCREPSVRVKNDPES